jgi:uncharacterized protein (DUF1697 family)
MQQYLGFLRGINVGGKSLIKMAELREALEQAGLQNVRSYIQSGNVLFTSNMSDKHALAKRITEVIAEAFQLSVATAVFTADEWHTVIKQAPDWWGRDTTWKHNLLILTAPIETSEAVEAIGILKPGIEAVAPGKRVVYQSMSFQEFGKTTTGKLASNPVYKKMTIRNYNTATKLAALCE